MAFEWSRHWWVLLILVPIILLIFYLLSFAMSNFSRAGSLPGYDMAITGFAESGGYGYTQAMADFAPEVEERKIAKTSTLKSEVERDDFDEADRRLHTIVKAAEGFILNENVQEVRKANRGTYSIKVPASAYDGVVEDLKAIGEVESFSENARDVTGQVVNKDVELSVERLRLVRLKNLYDSRASLEDKLRLETAIFDQERKIAYLENSLTKFDQDVVYSSLSVTLYVEEPALAEISFVGWGELIETFLMSLKGLLYFLFAVLPWVLLIAIIWWIVHLIRK